MALRGRLPVLDRPAHGHRGSGSRVGHAGKWRSVGCSRGGRIRSPRHDGQESQLSTESSGRKIAIVVLGKGRWRLIRPRVPQVLALSTKPVPAVLSKLKSRSTNRGVAWTPAGFI